MLLDPNDRGPWHDAIPDLYRDEPRREHLKAIMQQSHAFPVIDAATTDLRAIIEETIGGLTGKFQREVMLPCE